MFNYLSGELYVVVFGELVEWLVVCGIMVCVMVSDECDYVVLFVVVEMDVVFGIVFVF